MSLSRLFAQKGYDIVCAATGTEALSIAEQQATDIFLLDLVLPDMDGIEVLRRVKRMGTDSSVVMISAHGSVEKTVLAMKEGAENFVTKPIDLRRLEALVDTVGKCLLAEREAKYYRSLHSPAGPFVGVSKHVQSVLQLIDLLAENPNTTVLLSGESGTGKGVVAAQIHERSRRRQRPMVSVNCAELTQPLLESELFGHERGSFTDAKQRKQGLVEVADGGTLFLDEIGELDLGLQPKLLKVLESRTFRRVGGVRDIKVDLRIIAATNVDLEARVKEGRFREDLYFRLKVMPVQLLPLRQRREDIPPLVAHFLQSSGHMRRRPPYEIAPEALTRLQEYGWPGNVRELNNVLERAILLAKGDAITPAELPAELLSRPKLTPRSLSTLEQMERELIAATLQAQGGNRTRAAESLGISRSTLQEKIKRYGLRSSKKPS